MTKVQAPFETQKRWEGRVYLEQVLDEVDADEGRGAAHPGQVVGEHVAAQLEVVGDHGCH